MSESEVLKKFGLLNWNLDWERILSSQLFIELYNILSTIFHLKFDSP